MMQPNEVRIRKIIETIEKLLTYVAEHEITAEQIQNDYTVQWTITTPLYNIGEHTYQLSKELKDAYPDVPWSQISGMRHRLVHQYDDTNWNIVSYVVFHELHPFADQLKRIMKNE